MIVDFLRKLGPYQLGKRRLDSYQKFRAFMGKRTRGNAQQCPRISDDDLLVNLGCGEKVVQGWMNIDYLWNPNLDVCWDITKPLPFRSNSCRAVYSEHCLEHFDLKTATSIVSECYRILKAGGTLRLVVPDAELYIDLYNKDRAGEDVELPYAGVTCRQSGYSPMMALNRIFRDHGHLYCYDFRELRKLLESVGFKDIKQETYRHGRDATVLIDSEDRRPESLYVECVK